MTRWRGVLGHLRFLLQRHGWPAALGLALLVAGLGFYAAVVTQERARADELRAEAAALRKRIAAQPGTREATGAAAAAAFYASLPPEAAAPAALAAIGDAARANDVQVAWGEYRMTRDGAAPLLRYQITVPAQASYPRLRAWLGQVMNTLPAAGLDAISFKRDDVASEVLEARLRLTLFLRAR